MPSGHIAPAPPVMDQSMMMPPPEDEPPNKKARAEDHLIPETQFISMHKSSITIQVQAPNIMEKSKWRLNGQTISVSLSLTDPITTLKAKIQDETGMPPAKQKLSYEGMFFKDSLTVASYNLLSGTTIHLQIKERGGRKK